MFHATASLRWSQDEIVAKLRQQRRENAKREADEEAREGEDPPAALTRAFGVMGHRPEPRFRTVSIPEIEPEAFDVEGLERRWAEAGERRRQAERQQQPGLRKNVGSHSRGTIEQAVELLVTGMKSTATDMGLSSPNATRVRRLRAGGLLDWNRNDQPGLWVAPEVATLSGNRIVLRYWHDGKKRWLDPLTDAPPIRV